MTVARVYTAACGICDYGISTRTEADAVKALYAHLRTVHPDQIGAPTDGQPVP
jgi:hypothetical protein